MPKVTDKELANIVLVEYWQQLQSDISKLSLETKNGSKQKAYIDVLKLIAVHKKKWNHDLKNS